MRKLALKIAFHYLGRFYIWGGDDPSGFDCSGFVIEVLKSVGALPRKGDWTAAGLYKKFPRTIYPDPGDLVFWYNLNSNICHVEMVISENLSIGASGGGSKTKTVEDAIKQNAFIKIRPTASRSRIAGFVNPF